MYNVGFGDSFLLEFPAPDRPRKVLIDCGSHQAGPPPVPMSEIVDAILADAAEDGGPRIDVVICTHRHRDHVKGFESSRWAELRVSEVWMPWTEAPDDPVARRIREAQAKKGQDLALALAGLTGVDEGRLARARDIVENSLTNAAAMATLHHGFAGRPRRRFLPEKDGDSAGPVLSTEALPGVSVHVVGPSRDESVIRNMNPPPDESFLRAARTAASDAVAGPLGERWAVSPRGKSFGPWFRRTTLGPEGPPQARSEGLDEEAAAYVRSLGLTWPEIREVDAAGEDDPLAAAVSLDKAVNGTSLLLVFEMGRAFLLFPGDAQWGTWEAALFGDPHLRDLLAKTTFYKVSHHGSHNATPRELVNEVLGTDLLAMVSTRATTRFPEIPRGPLLGALETHARIARSDASQVGAPFHRLSPICIEARVPL
jgi:hypothetical protein